MILLSLLLALPSCTPASPRPEPLPAASLDELTSAYGEACDARDAAALAKLWKEHPQRILATFDADLEASLSAWEAAPGEPESEAIEALERRAQWAAQIASEVTGRPIFADYAASFAGWTADEKARFRAGQKAFGVAMGALREGRAEDALAASRECTALAMPLGDWWGSAMGLGGEGQALLALERHDEALLAASRARLLNHQLGLAGAELQCLGVMLEAGRRLGRHARALVAARDSEELAGALGHDDAREHFAAVRAELEELAADAK